MTAAMRTMMHDIGMMQHVIQWCCLALDWCCPSWQQCLLLPGEQSPLRLEWCLCHPSDPAWWHQLFGDRSRPTGLKISGRQRRTWPDSPTQVFWNDFPWHCSSSMSSTAPMHRHPWSWPHHCQWQPAVPAHLIYPYNEGEGDELWVNDVALISQNSNVCHPNWPRILFW